MTKIRYVLEAFAVYALYGFFKVLPVRVASSLGAGLAGTIGPRMAASRKALRNIRDAMPSLTEEECRVHICGMWRNLGRVMAEYAHIRTLSHYHVDIEGAEHIQAAIDQGKGAIFVGAHMGNWELYGASVAAQYGQYPALTYREPNNPYVAKLLLKARTLGRALKAFPKSRESGRKLLNTIKNGGYLGILIDQKYNEGVEVPFFGMPAMTNPVAVQLAQKYDCPLVPVRCERIDGVKFRITYHKPVRLKTDGENVENRAVEAVLGELHDVLQNWIMERPEQWLWLHRRWKTV